MVEVIFNKTIVQKQNLYDFIKQKMIDAGWENLSSKPDMDFDVMFSTGEDGKKGICFNMKDLDSGKVSFSKGVGQEWQIRMSGKYTPGTSGKAGVFQRPNEVWKRVLICQTFVPASTDLTVYYHVNKNRMMFAVDLPKPYGMVPTFLCIGMPDEVYIDEQDHSGTLMVSNNMLDNSTITNSVAYISDYAYVRKPSGYAINIYGNSFVPFRNAANKRIMSEIIYGSATEGTRGKISDVYVVPPDNVINGDTIIDDYGKRYVVLSTTNASGGWNTSFALNGICYIALRIQ